MSGFEALGVSKSLVKGLNELKIINPSPIQAQVIPKLLKGDLDLVGQAQTGTGKTAAYAIPMLEKIDARNHQIQGLVLCPTRELCKQVAKQIFKFTKYTDKIFTEAVYGGPKIEIQVKALKRPTQIVVATPGRLLDLLKKKALQLDAVKTLILDEADEMLSMGFKKELDEILSFLAGVQSKWLFSATMPQGIKQIVNTHLSEDALKIETDAKQVMNKNIEHQFKVCDEHDKLVELQAFLDSKPNTTGVIFCKTKNAVTKLTKQLMSRNVAATGIQGDLLQKERDKAMRGFKKGTFTYLVATDLAARGLDIPHLGFVVHYQLPDNEEYFTHRSGRTGRAGETGISLALVDSKELSKLRRFAKALHLNLNQV